MTFYGGTELASVYEEALDEGFGLVASNVAEPNVMIGLLQGAAQADSDLLLQMSNGACTFAGNGDPVAGLQAMGNYIDLLAAQYDVGVFLNMDHQTDLDTIRRQVELDVPSSIMIDASHEPFEENVARSREVVEMTEEADGEILVEAELGKIKGVEDEIVPPEGVGGDRETFFNDIEWSPTKDYFDPRVAGRQIRDRIAEVYADLAEAAGSAGRSQFT